MLILALAVAAMTARFYGVRPALYAGGASLASLFVAGLAPLALALIIYAANVAVIVGLWRFGHRLVAGRRTTRWGQAQRWVRRGWSLWNRRR